MAGSVAGSGLLIETSVLVVGLSIASEDVASWITGDVVRGASDGRIFTGVAGAAGGEGVVGMETEGRGGTKVEGWGGNGHSQKGVGKGTAEGTPDLGMTVGCIQSCGCK